MEYALQARSGQYPASQWEVKKNWENHRNQWGLGSVWHWDWPQVQGLCCDNTILYIYIYYPPLEVWNLSLCSVTFGSMIIAIIFHQGVKTTKLFQRSPGMFRRLLCQTVSPGVFMFMNVYDLWAFPRPISSSAWQISILLHLRDFSEFQRLRL